MSIQIDFLSLALEAVLKHYISTRFRFGSIKLFSNVSWDLFYFHPTIKHSNVFSE